MNTTHQNAVLYCNVKVVLSALQVQCSLICFYLAELLISSHKVFFIGHNNFMLAIRCFTYSTTHTQFLSGIFAALTEKVHKHFSNNQPFDFIYWHVLYKIRERTKSWDIYNLNKIVRVSFCVLMIATIAAVTFPFLIYWLSVSVIDETPSLFPLPVSVFSQSSESLGNVSSHPPISRYIGRANCVVSWPCLCSILARTKWSFIDRWYQERLMYRRYFWTLPRSSQR